LGFFGGEAVTPSGPEKLGTVLWMMISGFWIGGIVLGVLGVWWGIRFHRRFRMPRS
jgi:hypothetical protein